MTMSDYMEKEITKTLIRTSLKTFGVDKIKDKDIDVIEKRLSNFISTAMDTFDLDTEITEFTKFLFYVVIYQLFCIIKLEEALNK